MKCKILYVITCLFFAVPGSLISQELRVKEREFKGVVDVCEYDEVSKSVGVLPRRYQYHLSNKSHSKLAAHPTDLDARREAIIDAIMADDESAFYELAKSPITHEGGMKDQKFSSLVRDLNRLDRWPLRTFRQHPTIMKEPHPSASVLACHQWMTLPRTRQNPRRGNLFLLFDQNDWSLTAVNIHFFDSDRINLLPAPDSQLKNDPVRDRTFPEED